jgi:pheromone shutdown protein TraB
MSARRKGKMNYKIVVTSISAAILILTLVVLCFVMSDCGVARAMSLAVLILGCALGWFTGILSTPYDKQEQSRFQTYAKVISLFLSGYVLAKLDRVIEQLISVDTLHDQLVLFRLFAFVGIFLITLILVFVYRQYALINPQTKTV